MMKKTLSVIGALFLVSAMACGSGQKSDTTTPPPPPADTMGGADAGAMEPTGAAPAGNPCGAAATGNPCTK